MKSKSKTKQKKKIQRERRVTKRKKRNALKKVTQSKDPIAKIESKVDDAAAKVESEIEKFGKELARLRDKVQDQIGKTKSINAFLAKNSKFLKFGALTVGALLATRLLTSRPIKSDEPKVAKSNSDAYQMIKERCSDFGSPLHLIKTVSKGITPYKSLVRSGIRTNVGAVINRNDSFFLFKNAIKHTRYK